MGGRVRALVLDIVRAVSAARLVAAVRLVTAGRLLAPVRHGPVVRPVRAVLNAFCRHADRLPCCP
jgi:hypothetical protein